MNDSTYKSGDIVFVYDHGEIIKKEIYKVFVEIGKGRPIIKYECVEGAGMSFLGIRYNEYEVFKSVQDFISEMQKRFVS